MHIIITHSLEKYVFSKVSTQGLSLKTRSHMPRESSRQSSELPFFFFFFVKNGHVQ